MRISRDPKADLLRAQTETALALEALTDEHPIRQAGQLLIGQARDLVKNVPDELPPALDRADRQTMTAKAAFLHEKTRKLGLWWTMTESVTHPTWMERRRAQTEAEYFDAWMRELPRLSYELQHGFFADNPRDEIEEAYRVWHDLATRRQIRERHLPVISKAMALTATLDAFTTLARTIGDQSPSPTT